MKLCLMALLCSMPDSSGSGQTPQPRWTVDLQQQSGLRPFVTQRDLRWTGQQGVVFLTPDTVAVFQVNEVTAPDRLSKRSTSGGAGNFFLEVRVFDARDGHLIKSVRLVTNASFSKVLPTHDGKFIMRLGDEMYLLAADFSPLASRELPLKREARVEHWQLNVSPSGSEVVLVHDQVFSPRDEHVEKEGRARADVEILNADTLQTTKAFSLPHSISAWTAGEGFLVTSDPAVPSGKREFGFLDDQGRWRAAPLHGGECKYNMVAYRAQSTAAYGCGRILLLSPNGEIVFFRNYEAKELAGSVAGDERHMAVEFDVSRLVRVPEGNLQIKVLKPTRIETYRLSDSKRLLSISVTNDDVYYAISSRGALAVVDGTTIKLYQPEE